MSTQDFIYVLIATVEGGRVPLATFSNRSRCEAALEGELEDRLSDYGLRLFDCDHFTVEQWQVNAWLDSDSIKTLTSYDNRGLLAKRLVPEGLEGKTKDERLGNRFRRIMEK